MMIVMKPTATAEEVEAVVDRVNGVAARAHIIYGDELTVIGAIGDAEHVARLALEGAPGVDHMVPISKPYKLASSQITHGARTVSDIVTEVMDARDLELVLEVADVIQIGARNMQNYTLLSEIGRSGCPALIKRGLSSTLEELLMAAEYVLKEMTHLPVIVDPSHAAGRRDLVAPMSLAAAAAGADGLIVEVHPDPDEAICDTAQQLVADEFPQYLDRVRAAAAVAGKVLWEEPVASGR